MSEATTIGEWQQDADDYGGTMAVRLAGATLRARAYDDGSWSIFDEHGEMTAREHRQIPGATLASAKANADAALSSTRPTLGPWEIGAPGSSRLCSDGSGYGAAKVKR